MSPPKVKYCHPLVAKPAFLSFGAFPSRQFGQIAARKIHWYIV
jgi:hypothetical protein